MSQSGKETKHIPDNENHRIPIGNANQISEDSSNNKTNQITNKINLITNGQKQYLKRILNEILDNSSENSEHVCDFIIAERNEINIKESTAEWHIKVLGQLLRFHKFKNFKDITKDDILNYLNSLRKSSLEDPTNKSIGNRNNKQSFAKIL